MPVAEIPVDQRVIDIDSRRFASLEKALVELITNSDDSYLRLGKEGGEILVQYERHLAGAVLMWLASTATRFSMFSACVMGASSVTVGRTACWPTEEAAGGAILAGG